MACQRAVSGVDFASYLIVAIIGLTRWCCSADVFFHLYKDRFKFDMDLELSCFCFFDRSFLLGCYWISKYENRFFSSDSYVPYVLISSYVIFDINVVQTVAP